MMRLQNMLHTDCYSKICLNTEKVPAFLKKLDMRVEPRLVYPGSVYSNGAIPCIFRGSVILRIPSISALYCNCLHQEPTNCDEMIHFPSSILLSSLNLWIQLSTCRAIDSRDLEEGQLDGNCL